MNKMGRGKGACIFDRARRAEVNLKCWESSVSRRLYCTVAPFVLYCVAPRGSDGTTVHAVRQQSGPFKKAPWKAAAGGAGTEKGSSRHSLSLALCQRSGAERSSSSWSANPSCKSANSSTLDPSRRIFSGWVFVWILVGPFVADAAPMCTLKKVQVIVNSSNHRGRRVVTRSLGFIQRMRLGRGYGFQ